MDGYNGNAWVFDARYGTQEARNETYLYYAMAVRDGDVASIPEPMPSILILTGILLIGAFNRRDKARMTV
jgi:hypothetical protein